MRLWVTLMFILAVSTVAYGADCDRILSNESLNKEITNSGVREALGCLRAENAALRAALKEAQNLTGVKVVYTFDNCTSPRISHHGVLWCDQDKYLVSLEASGGKGSCCSVTLTR